MWFFKRAKKDSTDYHGPECPGCHSRKTRLRASISDGQPDYVQTWRGKRYLTYRCQKCGGEFSVDESDAGVNIEIQTEAVGIDDEEALKTAEENLKRETDEDGDHRFR